MGFGKRFKALWEFVLNFGSWEAMDFVDTQSGGRAKRETYRTLEGQVYVVEMFDGEPQRIIKPDGTEVVAGE